MLHSFSVDQYQMFLEKTWTLREIKKAILSIFFKKPKGIPKSRDKKTGNNAQKNVFSTIIAGKSFERLNTLLVLKARYFCRMSNLVNYYLFNKREQIINTSGLKFVMNDANISLGKHFE